MVDVRKVVEMAGGALAVGNALGISRISVYEWVAKDQIPPARIIAVARLTGWKLTPHKLARELYPNPGDGIPPAVWARLQPAKKGVQP